MDTTTLTAGIIFVLGFVGIIWIVEPISYYPVLGPVGNYMSFLSGDIGNIIVVLGLLIIQAIRLVGQVSEGAGRLLGTGQVGIAAAIAIVVAVLLARRENLTGDRSLEDPGE